MKKCPKCSLNLDDSVMKCTYCGYDFAEEVTEEPAEVINTEKVNEAPVQPAPEAPAQPVYNQYNYGGEQQTPPPPPYNQQSYNPYGAPQHKFCPRCGNQCDPNAVICVKCGMSFGPMPQQIVDDNPSTALKILCFFFPIVALILYIVEKDKKPRSAKEYGKWGLIGLAVNVGFSIISSILGFFLGLANMGNAYVYDEFGDYYYQILVSLFSMIK